MAKVINLDKEIFTFEEKVAKQANPIKYYIDEKGCHICISHVYDKDGYPRLHRNGKDFRMSRYVYSISNNSEIPIPFLVLHNCDNPNCINPSHLRLGTHLENMEDRKRRGRCPKGINHPNAKLNDSIVYFIKYESQNRSNKELATIFGVSEYTIRDIKNEKTWSHINLEMKNLSSIVETAA